MMMQKLFVYKEDVTGYMKHSQWLCQYRTVYTNSNML